MLENPSPSRDELRWPLLFVQVSEVGLSLTCICQGQWYFICRWVYLKIKDSHKPDKTPIKIQYKIKIIDLSGKEVLIGGPHFDKPMCNKVWSKHWLRADFACCRFDGKAYCTDVKYFKTSWKQGHPQNQVFAIRMEKKNSCSGKKRFVMRRHGRPQCSKDIYSLHAHCFAVCKRVGILRLRIQLTCCWLHFVDSDTVTSLSTLTVHQ